MIWENGIVTCIISYKKQIASPGLMQDTGCLGLVHWDDPEGWYGEGSGRGVQDGEHVLIFCVCVSFLKLCVHQGTPNSSAECPHSEAWAIGASSLQTGHKAEEG